VTPAPSNSIPQFKQTPETVFQPRTARGFQGGINKIVDAIRPSLGPFPRTVAIARATTTRSPEILDSGGIIARRIISLPDRDETPGQCIFGRCCATCTNGLAMALPRQR
jgi:hypothetical protein